jgi:hypothetical protein
VSGGVGNTASGIAYNTVGGGASNTASGTYFTTVAGGASNTASSGRSFVGGGDSNTASGYRSVVVGGVSNAASGGCSAVLGGSSNTASGAWSGAFGCSITASAACTFYTNNSCACSCMFATAFFETSDCRLKNIHNTFSAYDGINFSQFSWKKDTDNKSCFGYIAQEVEKVLPNAVHNNVEGYKQVDYNHVNTYKLSKLEERIAKLEAKLK